MKELRIVGGTSELIIRDNPDAEISVNGKRMSVSDFLEAVAIGLMLKNNTPKQEWIEVVPVDNHSETITIGVDYESENETT